MHNDDKWQLYYKNGEPIPGVWWDAERDNPEAENGDTEIIGVVMMFLYRQTEHGLEILWQRRAPGLRSFPDKFDFSAGGHINLGESHIDAMIREAHEEIGAKITTEDLKLVTMVPPNTNRFGWVYVVDWTNKPENFEFDDGEVSEVRWVPYEEMETFRKAYAKKPLQEYNTTFKNLYRWFKKQGLIPDGDN